LYITETVPDKTKVICMVKQASKNTAQSLKLHLDTNHYRWPRLRHMLPLSQWPWTCCCQKGHVLQNYRILRLFLIYLKSVNNTDKYYKHYQMGRSGRGAVVSLCLLFSLCVVAVFAVCCVNYGMSFVLLFQF